LTREDETIAELAIALSPKNDYDAILALHRQAGWNLSRVDGEVWGAWEDGELVGSVQFEEVGSADVLFVRAMVVREDARGRGIGARMFTHVMGTRAAAWWLESRSERVAFYNRLGFRVIDEEDIPPSIRELVRRRIDRQQNFMTRTVSTQK
jgi:N-acetylglutamate synthase-like GNAT family acetyltransferase